MRARKFGLTATVAVADDVLARTLDDEVVILNLRDGVYYGLADVGAFVWDLLQKPVTVAAIRDQLVVEYAVDRARCEEDLRALLTDLESRGLVVLRKGA